MNSTKTVVPELHSTHQTPVHNQTELDSTVAQIEDEIVEDTKNATFILDQLISAFDAFRNGCEKAIASYIKLGNEGQVTQKLVYGPQKKAKETQDVELLIKKLLTDYTSVKFVKKQGEYFALCEGKLYPFSQLLPKVNFNHICLTKSELVNYHKLVHTKKMQYHPDLPSLSKKDEKELSVLSLGEKEAINIYTGSAYGIMNSLMRGQLNAVIENNEIFYQGKDQQAIVNLSLKEALLHVAVAVSGLNKLPDYEPVPNENGEVPQYLYRGESSLPESILAARKAAVEAGGGVLTEMGFLSTSYTKPAEGFFGEWAKNGLMIQNLKGKKVTALSQFNDSEREVLLPPTQLQWLYHKEIVSDFYKNSINLFIAKPVTVPVEKPTIESIQAKDAWLLVKNLNHKENTIV